MGVAEEWQIRAQKLITEAWEAKSPHSILYLLNPRRDDWDSTWEQSIKHPKFVEQVEWEMEALQSCDAELFYFDPKPHPQLHYLNLVSSVT